MKKHFLLAVLLLPAGLFAQSLQKITLTEAYELSQKNYPAVKQKDLVKQTAAISLENLQKGFLPQFSLSGQATYQSDVTKVPFSLPGLTIESPSKDQYKLVADVSQMIYDGGMTKEQKALQQLNATVEDQKVEVELYKLKERINQLYLSILYLDEQLKQVDLVKTDIQIGIKRVEAQVQNGVAFKSNLNMLKAELLKTEQRAIEVKSSKKGLLDALSLFIGRELAAQVQLEKPVSAGIVANEIARPELKLYSEQQKFIGQQEKLITAKNLPRASLFAQGGYGRPGLNMLLNEFDFFYIGGLRLNWSLGGLYTKKKEKEQVTINKKMVEVQKETFLLNTSSQLKQQQAEIDKLQQLLVSDNEIISLRKSVTEAAKAQLENGVITANDFLKEVNAEDQARQTLITHQVQLLQAQINYQTILGK
ncbi:MAG: TolC family protein [Chitinophagaceae bacterium]|nr:TolC family protein [Chitinophagaceae bacterium]MBP6214964.1 TolC family protein [Chitinophagaceae bacterium]HQV85084.1 TolC family protein [Chitinophagaceae bacterium]HQX71401.1 TolC family protein [Chitinophagaceae bacterium]HQZ73009.1 TolC family protein [Chitinophagaceae bacterium]